MAWANLMEIAGVSISYLSGVTTPPSNNIQYDALVLGQDESAWQRSYGYGTRVWNVSANLYISVSVLSNSRMIEVVNPTSGTVFMRTSGGSGSAIKKADACFYINEDTQQACAVACYGTDYNNVWIESGAPNYSTELYQIIKGLIPPQYTWQSVPSISGKNGILSLATIKDDAINNGDPVNNAVIDAFSSLPTSALASNLLGGSDDRWFIIDGDTEEVPPRWFTRVLEIYLYSAQRVDFDFAGNIVNPDESLTPFSVLASCSTSGNVYLSILVDDENEVAKVSFLHDNGNNTYSSNQ